MGRDGKSKALIIKNKSILNVSINFYTKNTDAEIILGFKWWQLAIALIAGAIYYYHYNSSLGFAFANTFLLSALVFDLVCYATTVLKRSMVWRKI